MSEWVGVWCCGGVELGRIFTRSCQVPLCVLSRLFVLGFLVELVCGLDVTCVGCEVCGLDWIVGIVGRVCFVAVISLSLPLFVSTEKYSMEYSVVSIISRVPTE